MARKKRHHRRKTHKKRGIHGTGLTVKSSPMAIGLFLGEVLAGYVAASFIDNKFLTNVMPDKPAVKHGGLAVIGGGTAMVIKNPHIKAIGIGAALYGGVKIAEDTKVIGDIMIGSTDSIMENIMIGGASNNIAAANTIAYASNMSEEGLMNGTEDISEEVMM